MIHDSSEEGKIPVMVTLTDAEAVALAQLVKRFTHSDAEEKATSEAEAYLMMDGVNAVMRALAYAGYAPR